MFWINFFEYCPRLKQHFHFLIKITKKKGINEKKNRIWFFGLVDMEHSPYELFLALFLLPLVLSIKKVQEVVSKEIKIMKLIGLVGIASYWIKQDKGVKLMMVLIGSTTSMTLLFSTWFHSKREMQLSVISNILALLIVISINFANYSMLPVWSNDFANIFFILLTVGSVFISPRESLLSDPNNSSKKIKKKSFLTYIRHGTSLGSLIFMIQTLMGIHFQFILIYF